MAAGQQGGQGYYGGQPGYYGGGQGYYGGQPGYYGGGQGYYGGQPGYYGGGQPGYYGGGQGYYGAGQPAAFTGRGSTNYRRPDDAILDDVQEFLLQSPHVDGSDIQAQVRDGNVTLTGSVPDKFQKRAAEDGVEVIWGVQGVTNQITVKPPTQPTPPTPTPATGDQKAQK